MELFEIRCGNYVTEFKYSSRDRALEPFFRVEQRDLAYHNFLQAIPIDLEWCKRLKMDIDEASRWTTGGNFDWIAEAAGVSVRSYKGEITVFQCMGGSRSILEHIKHVHQLQNFYYGIWGFEIDEKNPTIYYNGNNELFNHE